MYPKQPPSFTYLVSQPTTNPNPDDPTAYTPYPHFAEPALHAPGTNPYVNPPLTHVGYETQTHFYEDPSANWFTRQAAPLRYDPGTLASTSLNSCWTNQPLMNSVPKQSKVIQPLRCEVCKIDCNSRDVYEKHVSGKKHQRNLHSTAATLQNSCGMVNHVSLPSQIGGISGATSMAAAAQELEKKKQKLLNSGTAADSVRICTICNVACNGEEVFVKHLSGKKHAAQAALMSLGGGVGQCFAEIKAQNNRLWSAGHKKTKVVQSAWCEVCKINCNSNDVYVTHLQGKKHQKNLENLEKAKSGTITAASSAATPTANLIGPMENPDSANKSTGTDSQKKRTTQLTVDDLETKKRKVVESGAAAADVRICTVCNVVCNSQTVFDSHIAGQKHATMVKKQAQGLTESAAPQVVCAT